MVSKFIGIVFGIVVFVYVGSIGLFFVGIFFGVMVFYIFCNFKFY